jgi:hypothetical protein
LSSVEHDLFEGNDAFKTFYAMVDGVEVYDFESDAIMIRDGVLYSVVPEGYVLVAYPPAKEDKEFTVAEGTIRIEFLATMGNQYLETVILPKSLLAIGNYAFYQCDNLKTVKFNSYYAPALEGTMTGSVVIIDKDTVGSYPNFDKLYQYDYYYHAGYKVDRLFYYYTFKGLVTTVDDLTYVIPENSEGYDSALYQAYFAPSEENTGITTGRYALAFINAAKKLPEVADRFDKALIEAAINAYNALVTRKDELAQVDTALVEHFMKVRSEYNVSVVENLINHLFDMDKSEYSFEKVKAARAALQALTADEQARVSNAATLSTKVEELAAAMGVEVDFTKTFAQHYPDEPTVTPPDDQEPDTDDNGSTVIVVIVCVSVVVLAAVAVVVLWLFKKKKKETVEEQAE